MVPGGPVSGNEPSLELLQEIESSKGHGGGEPCAMECVHNEVCKQGWRSGSGCW